MEKEEIIEAIKLIGYDKNKHKDIKEAFMEFLQIPKYKNVMRGIVTNVDDLNVVQDAVKYYKLLKEIDINEINELIEDKQREENTNNTEINNNKSNSNIECIVYNFKGKSYLKIKNSISKKYDTILEANKIETHNYYVTADNSIYNFIGKKIFDKYKKFRTVTDKIIEVTDDNDELFYISTDGLHKIQKKKYGKSYNNIVKIFSSDIGYDVLNNFFDFLISGKQLDYLNYNIGSISDEYLYCFKGKEVAYFKIDGEKIISTEDYHYSTIVNLTYDKSNNCYERKINIPYKTEKNKSNHVAVVGSYDDKFKIKYGLYDLDLKKEILEPYYESITRFDGCLAIGYDENNNSFLIVRNNYGDVKCHNISSQFKKMIYT